MTALHPPKSISISVCGAPRYRSPDHAHLPHVVKMSGGRSSAAMTLSMARSGHMDATRGDVVLFANTTAEHPATYEFASQVCDELEDAHGLPCLWYEFCTVEVPRRRGTGWTRRAAYRLVTRDPAADNDPFHLPGFRSDGSAFEALASLKAMLPNRHLRICTRELKTVPGAALVSEWLAGGPGPAPVGHRYERQLASPADAAAQYRGSQPVEWFSGVSEAHHRIDPPGRPAQNWQDFTGAELSNPRTGPRSTADVYGVAGTPVRYLTLLGLRGDEPDRVARMEERSLFAEGATGAKCRDSSQPAGEICYAPLSDHGVESPDVSAFWAGSDYDLAIDQALGNCVYCFMKGAARLTRIASTPDPMAVPGTPSDIDWWADIEQRYARPSNRDAQGGKFKFLSLSGEPYADIAASARSTPPPKAVSRPPTTTCLAPARTERWRVTTRNSFSGRTRGPSRGLPGRKHPERTSTTKPLCVS